MVRSLSASCNGRPRPGESRAPLRGLTDTRRVRAELRLVRRTRIEQISLTRLVRVPLAPPGRSEVLATDGLGSHRRILG
jgi:hypothetical protein